MRFNLRLKIILAVSLSLILIFGVIVYLQLTHNVGQLRSDLNEQSKSFAALSSAPIGNTFLLYQDSGSIRITQQVNKYLALDPDVSDIRIVSVDGAQLYSSDNKQHPAVEAVRAASFDPEYVKIGKGYTSQIVQPFFEDSGAHRYSIIYDISTKRVEHSVRDVIRLILYVGLAFLIVSIAATSWLFNRLFVKPLRDVSRSANKISAGDYDQQIVPKNHDEIGDLALSVNKMADSLKTDIVKLKEVDELKNEFLMIASHNLRTPITVMRGYMDMMELAESPEELKQAIGPIKEGVTRLHLLAEDLLTISTLETGSQAMSTNPVGAKSFIDSTVSEFEVLALQKKLHWQFDNEAPDDTKLDLSQANMRSALGNIIDNAIKFTKEGGAIRVTARLAGQRLVFTVADTGTGISLDEVPKLFTKFHRGTSTLTYDYEGVGIGLYLTKLIIEKHGGSVTVQSQAGKGSTFAVYLPLAANAAPSSPPAPAGHHPAP